jgi:hypothetical protein
MPAPVRVTALFPRRHDVVIFVVSFITGIKDTVNPGANVMNQRIPLKAAKGCQGTTGNGQG